MIKILKLISIIIFSSIISIGVFSFVIAGKLYFPDIKQIANDEGAGLNLIAYQYDPWLWNKEKITAISSPDVSSLESGYVVHRSPKSEKENTIKRIHIGGNIIAVAPDESGYFYISNKGKIFKRSWQGETIISADLGMKLEPISRIQLIGMGSRLGYQPILFFSNNTKMAFWGTPLGERDGYLFIWNLENNEIKKIFRQNFGDYNDLIVEDDKLYIERANVTTFKKLIVE
jgi:hypothetical protein